MVQAGEHRYIKTMIYVFYNHTALFTIILSLLLPGCSRDSDKPANESLATSITVAQAEIRDLSASFTVASEVVAYKRSYVASRLSGLVEEVNFEEGQMVRQNEVLARLDVRQQRIELRRSQAALNEVRDIFDRTQILFESGAATRAELLTAQRNLEQAESDVARLELSIGFGEIKAPIDGIVTARLVEMGNNVSVNERMFTVTDMGLLVVRPGVSELNLAGLEEGQQVDVHLDVYPDTVFRGQIRRIFPGVDAVSRLFTTEVEVFQDENMPVLRPGFLARVRFAADDSREVITVPSEAISERNGDSVLFVLNEDENEVRVTPVRIGVQRDGYAEIPEGIEAGTKVAAANLDALNDGSSVRVVGTFRRHGFRN